jgi:hypothetical protein
VAPARLPTGDDEYVYVTPTHVVMTHELSEDPTPMIDVID